MLTNSKKRNLFLLLLAFVGVWFLFGSGDVLAVAKFGESCSGKGSCQAGLQCFGNTCVECYNSTICNDRDGGRCNDGVCVSPGGNGVGKLCASNDQCVSGVCDSNTSICRGGSSSTTKTNEADEDNPLGGFPGEDLSFQDVNQIVIGLACWLARTASLLAAIFVIWAGLKFVTAGGDPKKYQSAKDNFKAVLLGILVIYGVYVIIATVANAVGIRDFSFIPLVC
ncbi:MAG: hypothetical protein HYX21_00225 [Candidatus Yanofskybacteria bacterium]|nr:hypothetical protein [Candidatus Yanofskybacteria bacterium]